MFKKKCKSLPQLPSTFKRNYRKYPPFEPQGDHLHFYPNYHFHIPPRQQKHLLLKKNVKRSQSNQQKCDQTTTSNVHHSTSSASAANWRLNSQLSNVVSNNETCPSLPTNNKTSHHDSDLSIHSSLSNHSELSSISVNSSNLCNTSSQLNTTSGIPTSYSSSAPGISSHHALYYPNRLDKYILNRSNCTNHSSNLNTSHCSGDYVDCAASTNPNHQFINHQFHNQSNQYQPTPPPLPRYSSYNSISSQPFRSNLTTPIAGSLHLTASQISLEFNTWYNQLLINQEEQQKSYRKSVREWVRTQPLSILQLDLADREVLKIAGI